MGNGLQRAFAAAAGVAVGQFWQDNDPRCKKVRTLRIDSFGTNARGAVAAHCSIVETGRRVLIAIKRFKPTSNGYRLVSNKEGE